MTTNYDIGDKVKNTATFRNAAGALADPTTVIFKSKTPAGAVTTYSGGLITHPSTGIYTLDYSITSSGTHIIRVEGTGAIEAASEGVLVVRSSRF